MNLKEQTVYIPIDISEVSETTFITMSKVRGQIHLKKDQLICLSKEQLIELVNKTWAASKKEELFSKTPYPTKEQFINNIIL